VALEGPEFRCPPATVYQGTQSLLRLDGFSGRLGDSAAFRVSADSIRLADVLQTGEGPGQPGLLSLRCQGSWTPHLLKTKGFLTIKDFAYPPIVVEHFTVPFTSQNHWITLKQAAGKTAYVQFTLNGRFTPALLLDPESNHPEDAVNLQATLNGDVLAQLAPIYSGLKGSTLPVEGQLHWSGPPAALVCDEGQIRLLPDQKAVFLCKPILPGKMSVPEFNVTIVKGFFRTQARVDLQGREIRLQNVPQLDSLVPFDLPAVGINFGVIRVQNMAGKTFPLHIPGLMKSGEYAEADVNPAGGTFLDFAGPFDGPTLRGRAKVSQGGITFPPLPTPGQGSASKFLDKMHWNLHLTSANGLYYFYEQSVTGGVLGKSFLYDLFKIPLAQAYTMPGSWISFHGQINNNTFRVRGSLSSLPGKGVIQAGMMRYDREINVNLVFNNPDNYPTLEASAARWVQQGTGAGQIMQEEKLVLYIRDPKTGIEHIRDRVSSLSQISIRPESQDLGPQYTGGNYAGSRIKEELYDPRSTQRALEDFLVQRVLFDPLLMRTQSLLKRYVDRKLGFKLTPDKISVESDPFRAYASDSLSGSLADQMLFRMRLNLYWDISDRFSFNFITQKDTSSSRMLDYRLGASYNLPYLQARLNYRLLDFYQPGLQNLEAGVEFKMPFKLEF
jgi:hypothetical protein